jgi:hypothetical protein
MSSGTNSERITQNVDDINKSTEKIKNLKIATFQDKTITENGTYQADDDYTGLGKVIVDVPSSGIDTSDATATASEIIAGRTAYVNGEKIEGTMLNLGEIMPDEDSISIQDETFNGKGVYIYGTATYHDDSTISGYEPPKYILNMVNVTTQVSSEKLTESIGLTSDKIVKGNTILGIEGTYEGGVKLKPIYATGEFTTYSFDCVTTNMTLESCYKLDDFYLIWYYNSSYHYLGLYQVVDGEMKPINTNLAQVYNSSPAYCGIITYNDEYVLYEYYNKKYKVSIETGEVTEEGSLFSGTRSNPASTRYGYATGGLTYSKFNPEDFTRGNVTETSSTYYTPIMLVSDIVKYRSANNQDAYLLKLPTSETEDFKLTTITGYGGICGMNFYRNKIFTDDGKIYNYDNNGNIGDYICDINVAENGYIDSLHCLNEKYYYDNNTNTLYTFDEDTNQFSIAYKSTKSTCGKNNCFATRDNIVYDFKQTDIEIGFIYEGNSYFYGKSTAVVNSNDILDGITFYDKSYNLVTGTMPNNGELNYSVSTVEQTIPEGYTSGGIISAVDSSIDENIIPENIKKGVTILGIEGTYEGENSDEELNQIAKEILGEEDDD